ncbi:MAG TPA: phosphopantetheine-binding protein [Methylocystis sp.]|nr:phosphopantetheine-binding protein [Methylocystis sp.]
MIETIRRALDACGGLKVAAASLAPDADLYRAGLTPFAAVQVVLALERSLKIEFPQHLLNRRSLASMNDVRACIREAQSGDWRLDRAA